MSKRRTKAKAKQPGPRISKRTKRPVREQKGAPPKIEDNEKTRALLKGLGAILATQKESASVLGVTEQTLITFFKKNPVCRDVYETGKDSGKVSLRRDMFALAKKNATMALFLAMNVLGMKDRRAFGGDAEDRPKRIIFEGGLPKVPYPEDPKPVDDGKVVPINQPAKAAGA